MSLYRLCLPSSIDRCPQLRLWIGTIGLIEGYSEAFTEVLKLTVHEIFVNAVIHAHHDDVILPVVLVFETDVSEEERYLEVRVRDCGAGFDPERTVAAICSGREEPKSGGRGLFLVNHYVKSFRIEKLADGCVVVMRYIAY
ncbi:MAG: ATP-binding protein [Chlorobaculum sp.]|jgi:anti-sigma regulatory factor (Ser/Thr protein kinase)|nr:ATP-binding protein [Chlorobaculum sp.]